MVFKFLARFIVIQIMLFSLFAVSFGLNEKEMIKFTDKTLGMYKKMVKIMPESLTKHYKMGFAENTAMQIAKQAKNEILIDKFTKILKENLEFQISNDVLNEILKKIIEKKNSCRTKSLLSKNTENYSK